MIRYITRYPGTMALWGIVCILLTGGVARAQVTVDFIGQQVIPHDHRYKDTVVGGLSGVEYNPGTGRYAVISDDRSKYGPARFYEMTLDFDADGFSGWRLVDRHYLRRPDGRLFPKAGFFDSSTIDPEAIRLAPGDGGYFWASEGDAGGGIPPFVGEMTLDGAPVRAFTLPGKYLPDGDETRGVRDNLAFEALTVDVPATSITVATEGPLVQDGAEPTVEQGAMVRFLQLDLATGRPAREYVYPVSPVQREALPFGRFSVNGVVDILAVSAHEYLVLERSFSMGTGLSVRLYVADRTAATDVLAVDSLKEAAYQPMTKTLLLDLDAFGIAIDNIEGMTFGPRLGDGRRSLVMVSDNNFRSAQITQILVFAIDGLGDR